MKAIRMKVVLIAVMSLSLFFSQGVLADQKKWPRRVSVGSASPGGGFYLGASALAKVISKMPDHRLSVSVEITGASKHNVQLLQSRQIDIGLAATEVAWEAWHGQFAFENKKQDRVRTLLPGWPGVYMFVSLAQTGVKSIRDLEDRSYSVGPRKSSNELFGRRVFKALGVQPNLTNLPTSDASRALVDGTVSGFSIAWPATVVTQLETQHKVEIITLNTKEKEIFSKAFPQYVYLTIPAGEYKAVPEAKSNFGLYNLFLCDKDLPEDFVYALVKHVYSNVNTIAAVQPKMKSGMRLANLKYTTVPYHKGAAKYFLEQGAKIPAHLMPVQ